MALAYSPAPTPSPTPLAYCRWASMRCSTRLRLQASSSQTSVPGRPPLVSQAMCSSQSCASALVYRAAMASVNSTPSTARKTTPRWQASKISTGDAEAV